MAYQRPFDRIVRWRRRARARSLRILHFQVRRRVERRWDFRRLQAMDFNRNRLMQVSCGLAGHIRFRYPPYPDFCERCGKPLDVWDKPRRFRFTVSGKQPQRRVRRPYPLRGYRVR